VKKYETGAAPALKSCIVALMLISWNPQWPSFKIKPKE